MKAPRNPVAKKLRDPQYRPRHAEWSPLVKDPRQLDLDDAIREYNNRDKDSDDED